MINTRINTCEVLRELVRDSYGIRNKSFKKVLLVGMQHVLETTVDMLSVMKEYGLADAVIGGKKYSTNEASAIKIQKLGFSYVPDGHQLGYGRFDDCMQEVVHKIWHTALQKIEKTKFDLMIILDDGADLLRATPGAFFNGSRSLEMPNKPERIVGIEQTRGGTNHPLFKGLPFPVINVAGSFAKTSIEYPKVSEIVCNKMTSIISASFDGKPNKKLVAGVIGCGTMGKAIAASLVEKGFTVIAYDKNNSRRINIPEVIQYDNATVLIANANIIIGCTGEDVTNSKDNLSALLYSRQKKILVSTGSKDYEFNTLLRTIQNETKDLGFVPDPLQTIHYNNYVGVKLEVIRGGFPINFSNAPHSVSPEYIWPTRGALILACLSAAQMHQQSFSNLGRNINSFMLSPEAQLLIVNKYTELNNGSSRMLKIDNLTQSEISNFIINHSEGEILNYNNDAVEAV